MKFFTNKHVIASLIIAPILAVLAWFAVDDYVSEKPQSALAGQSYNLIAKSNCRWESGYCFLENEDLEIHITTNNQKYGQNSLMVRSQIPIDLLNFALVSEPGKDSSPMAMKPINPDYTEWVSDELNLQNNQFLQFVFGINQSRFYAETPTTFVYKEPVYQ